MIGRVLGSYRIDRELGRGGMGQVYLAEHVTIGKRAAVKVLLPERAADPALVQRFFNEARAAAGIRHPGMVEVFDFGTDDAGRSYLIMEWLDGESLAARLRRGRPSHAQALDIARQVAGALAAAHVQGIVHRDLKPDNLFLVPDAAVVSGLRVKVLDFGIAKLGAGAIGGASITASDAIVGTPLYMAPEQCEGGRPIDHRADMYALGAILFEMVTGRPPFVEKGAGAVIAAHLRVPPPSPRSLAADLQADLDALILRLLAKDPAARGAGMDALFDELDAMCLRHPPERITDPGRSVDALAATQASSRDALASADTAASSPAAFAPTAASADALSSTASSSAAELLTPAGAAPTAAPDAVPATRVGSRRRWPLLAGGAALVVIGAGAAWMLWPRGGDDTGPDAAALRAASTDQLDGWCRQERGIACRTLGQRYERATGVERSFDRAGASYVAGCDAGDARSCTQLGLLHSRGQGVTFDVGRAADLLQRACDAGDGDGCTSIADLFAAGRNRPFDPAAALALRRRGCDAGASLGCREASLQLRYGLGVDRDPDAAAPLMARALQLATSGCDADDPDECRILGLLHFYGRGVPRDAQRAFALLQRACDNGATPACNDVGQAYLFGIGPSQDVAKGAEVIRTACDNGSIESCLSLGLLYAQGFGVPADPARSRTILEDICKRHGDAYCIGVATLVGAGIGMPHDRRRYHDLNERVCLAGSTSGCAFAAKAYLVGKVVARDPARAEMLYARGRALGDPGSWAALGDSGLAGGDYATAVRALETACDLSDLIGCEPLAELYFSGQGVQANPARGRDVLERQCREGGPTGCFALARRLRDGDGMSADPTRALETFQRSCDLSWDKGCLAAADMLDGKSSLRPDPERAAALRKRACEMAPVHCPKPPAATPKAPEQPAKP